MEKEGRKIEYYQAEKLSWNDFVKTIQKEFVPGKLLGYSVAVIFLLVIIFGIIMLPWAKFTNFSNIEGNLEIKIGIPWTFFKVNLTQADEMPIQFKGLFLDLIVYLIIGYMINVAWNAFYSSIKELKKKTKGYEITKKEN